MSTTATSCVIAWSCIAAQPGAQSDWDDPITTTAAGIVVHSDRLGNRVLEFDPANLPERPMPSAPPPAPRGSGDTDGQDWIGLGPSGGDVRAIGIRDASFALAGIAQDGGPDGGLFRSLDGANTWVRFGDASWVATGGELLANAGIFAIAFDATRAFVGTANGLYVGADLDTENEAWTLVDLGVGSRQAVLSIAVDASTGDVWVGLSDAIGLQPNTLVRQLAGTETWENVTPSLPDEMSCNAIAVERTTTPARVVACFSGIFSDAQIRITSDRGDTWTSLNADLPGGNPVFGVDFAPGEIVIGGGRAFAGQFLGVFRATETTEGWSGWTELSQGWARPKIVNDVAFDDDRVLAATSTGLHAFDLVSGAWSFDLASPSRGANTIARSVSDELFVGTATLGIYRGAAETFALSSTGLDALEILSIAHFGTRTAIAFQGINEGGVLTMDDLSGTWIDEPLPIQRINRVAFSPDGVLHALADGPVTAEFPEGIYREDATGWTSIGPVGGPGHDVSLSGIDFGRSSGLIVAGGRNVPTDARELWRFSPDDENPAWQATDQGPSSEVITDVAVLVPYDKQETVTVEIGEELPTDFDVPAVDLGATRRAILSGFIEVQGSVTATVTVENPNEEQITFDLQMSGNIAASTSANEFRASVFARDRDITLEPTDDVPGEGNDTRMVALTDTFTISGESGLDGEELLEQIQLQFDEELIFTLTDGTAQITSDVTRLDVSVNVRFETRFRDDSAIVATFDDGGQLPQVGGVLVSGDAGSTWSELSAELPPTIQGAAVEPLRVPGGILVADRAEGGVSGGVLRSLDGGETWRSAGHIGPIASLVVDPRSDLHLYGTTDGPNGARRSIDGGGIFESLPGSAIDTFTATDVALITGDDARLLVATSGGVFVRRVTYVPTEFLYVDAGAPPGGSGLSWSEAYQDVQSALDAAFFDTTPTEIRIAEGTYAPTRANSAYGTTFVLEPGDALVGGFPAGGATEPDPMQHETVLTGDIDGDPTTDDNTDHVLVLLDATTETRLEHLTIRDGVADGLDMNGNGGGVLVIDGTPTISSCTFQDNRGVQGGAIMLISDGTTPPSTALVRECTFERNDANSGGAIGCDGINIEVDASMFVDNTAANGGAMIGIGVDRFGVHDSLFDGNAAETGGAISIFRANADLLHNELRQNTATQGSGLYTFLGLDQVVRIQSNIFTGNDGAEGTIYAVGGDGALDIFGCLLVYNDHLGTGQDGVWIEPGPRVRIANSVLWRNAGEPIIGDADLSYSLAPASAGGGDGMIDADPELFDPLGLDFVPGTGDENLRTVTGSPLVDAGSVEFLAPDTFDADQDFNRTEPLPRDLDGRARIADVAGAGELDQEDPIDIGPYERESCLCEVVSDGVLDLQDLLLMLELFFEDDADVDFDRNGSINVADLLIFLDCWIEGVC